MKDMNELNIVTDCNHTPKGLNIHCVYRTVEALTEDPSIFKKAKNLLKDLDKTRKSTGISSSSMTGLTGNEDADSAGKREDSYKLLWEELSKDTSATTPESLCRTVQGMAVLRARQVLACVLRMWPRSGPKLGTTTLGCVDIIQYFCLLDLLLDQQNKEEREKVCVCVCVLCGVVVVSWAQGPRS